MLTKLNWSGETKTGLDWNVYAGDARCELKKIPKNTFDCVVTSPPYFWLRDYQNEHQIGQEETVEEYVEAISSVMDEVYRVLKSNGLLFLNLGDTYYSGKGKSQGRDRKSNKRRFGLRAVDKGGGMGIGLERKTVIGIPWRIALNLIERKWILRSPIIWQREAFLPESVMDRPRRNYEYIFLFSKGRKYYFDRDALEGEEDIWRIVARPKTNGINTAPFPDELVQRCINVGCPPGGSVLDPFAGSGTTLRVALQSNRSATGIDLNSTFCEYIAKQLEQI